MRRDEGRPRRARRLHGGHSAKGLVGERGDAHRMMVKSLCGRKASAERGPALVRLRRRGEERTAAAQRRAGGRRRPQTRERRRWPPPVRLDVRLGRQRRLQAGSGKKRVSAVQRDGARVKDARDAPPAQRRAPGSTRKVARRAPAASTSSRSALSDQRHQTRGHGSARGPQRTQRTHEHSEIARACREDLPAEGRWCWSGREEAEGREKRSVLDDRSRAR